MTAMHDDPLETPVQFVSGVGPERAQLLHRLGLTTVEDLLFYVPRSVLDLSNVCACADLQAGVPQTIRGTVVERDGRRISGGRTMQTVLAESDGDYLKGVWFNQPWVLKKLHVGQCVLFSGKPKQRAGRWEMSHPRLQTLETDDPAAVGEILPRYGLTDGIRMEDMRRIVRNAVERYGDFVVEYLPAAFREDQQLVHRGDAVRQLHSPETAQRFESARRRLVFDDLLEFQLGLALRRRAWQRHERAVQLPTTTKIDARIRRLFPFEFTTGQSRAVDDIVTDLNSGHAMHRLLQADVGAGKTAVAIYAMLVAAAAGYQAVLMAPTEVLARQHEKTIDAVLAQSRVRRQSLTGQLTTAARKQALAEIRSGEISIVIGTQAIIQDDVDFHRLGVVVIDEQHKFGVMQRARFSQGEECPHILVMTATPIPRSLCLTQFGDLDITVIPDLPPGRRPVVTSRVSDDAIRARAWTFVRQQLESGRQAYVVCPRIDSDSGSGSGGCGAEQIYRELSDGELRAFRVDLVHGQMHRDAKDTVMDRFRRREIDVLVATTVVEVGVDVPNATLMIVYQAERFGLSQLHQLRGRVGRGKFQGYCWLFSASELPEATQRLTALEKTTDGFRIAEADFELRGPGDILGTRQHGQLPLKVADLIRDQDQLRTARKLAFQLVTSGAFDDPEFAPLKIRVLERFGQLMELPQSG